MINTKIISSILNNIFLFIFLLTNSSRFFLYGDEMVDITKIPNYKLQKVYSLQDKPFEVYVYVHEKTLATVVFIRNPSDNDRMFSIGFKTIPSDSTGVFHIIEHSVLEGSKKYPVKGLFNELDNGNISTYLNALTYSDHTVYPVSSNNEASFINLTNVYLDSVFNPLVTEVPEIFYQEGIRREFDENGKLQYNGVVFNEMSGTTSVSRAIDHQLKRTLLPKTGYSYISGGDPYYIPDLSYEVMIDTYKRFYHPTNSLMFFYGNVDIVERLRYIDENYLSKYEIGPMYDVGDSSDFEPSSSTVIDTYPSVKDGSEENEAHMVIAYSLKDNSMVNLLAVRLILQAIFEDDASEYRQRLLDLGLSKDISYGFLNVSKNPIVSVTFSGIDVKNEEKIRQVVEDLFFEISKKGVSEELIRSIIASDLFDKKKIPSGNIGLNVYMNDIYDGWLYRDDPGGYLDEANYLKNFKELKSEDFCEFFKYIIKKNFIDNNKKYVGLVVPDDKKQTEKEKAFLEKLEQEQATLKDIDIKMIELILERTQKYSSYQNTDEDLAKIPSLSLEDLKKDSDFTHQILPTRLDRNRGSFLTFDSIYDDIDHVAMFFDISNLNKEEIQYLSLILALYERVSTKDKNFLEINRELNLYGDMYHRIYSIYNNVDNKYLFILAVGMAFLNEDRDLLLNLSKDILYNSIFTEEDKIIQILQEHIERYEEYTTSHSLSMDIGVNTAFYSVEEKLSSIVSGREFYGFIKKILKGLEDKSLSIDELSSRLENVRNKVLKSARTTSGIVSKKDNFNSIASSLETIFLDELSFEIFDFNGGNLELSSPEKIGFKIPQDTFYLSYVNKVDMSLYPELRSIEDMAVINSYLYYFYLYNKIRAEGGAYSTGFSLSLDGVFGAYSYRDPNIKNTIETIRNMARFMREVEVSSLDELKSKITTISSTFSPVSPVEKANIAFRRYFRKRSEKEVKELRNNILNVDLDKTLKGCVAAFSKIVEDGGNLVISGPESGLKESGTVDRIEDIIEK